MRFSGFEEMLRHYADNTPKAPALWLPGEEGPEPLGFLELEARVDQRCRELRGGGKTCLAVFSDGSAECVITIFAAVRAGMQVVLLDDALPDAAAAILLRYTDADAIWSGDGEREEDLASALTPGVSVMKPADCLRW